MKQKLLILAVAFLAITIVGATWLGFTSPAAAQPVDDPAAERLRLISEETGLVASEQRLSPECDFDAGYGLYLCPAPAPAVVPQRDPAAAARAREMLNSTGLLLMPDSSVDRVMAFDPITGNLVDPDFIPSHPTLGTLINAILSASRDSILVSDQIQDVVHEFDLDGNYLGIFAPAGGANPAILDNIRGIALRPNGNLLVTVGSGANANAVAEFDTAGNYLGNFVAIGSGGLDSPFDAYERPADWLVGGINSNMIHRYDLAGAYIANLAPIDSFPEQIRGAATGNVLVANFSGTQEGVVEYTEAGALVGIYNPAALGGYRGVYELPNGNILTTTGSGVYEIDRAGNIVSTKVTGVSGRFIEYLPPSGADLDLEKSVTPAEVAPGETVEYVVEFLYTDAPTGTAVGIILTDVVPIYLTGVTWQSSGAVVTPTGAVDYAWLVQDLLPGDGGTITITGEIDQGLAAGFTFTNTAVITSALADVNPDNNIDEVALTILNAAPVALADEATTPEEQPVNIAVLDNDSDPNGDALTVVDPGTPAHGTATTDGTTILYTPAPDFSGTDTFTYTVEDPAGLADSATITVTVTPVNDAPVAVDDEATTLEEQPVTIDVLANDFDPDGDPLLIIDLTAPSNGTATTDGATIIYTPTLDFAGVATWTYTIADPGGLTATATVLVTVTDVNDPPTISEIPDQWIAPGTTLGPLVFTVADVDTPAVDLELSVMSSNLALVPVDQILFGGSGITRTITITPTAGMTGTSTITITVSDGADTASETFLLTVLEVVPPRFQVYLPIVTKAGP